MKKKVAALLLSFMVACSCIVSWIPQPANAAFLKDYMEQYREENTDPSASYAAVITLKDKAISEYEEARRLGIGTFVQTAEGQDVYQILVERQNLLLAEIEMLLDREIAPSYRYTAALNGFCIDITEAEYQKILGESDVLDYSGIYLGLSTETPEQKSLLAATRDSSKRRADVAAGTLAPVGNDGTYGDGTGMVVAIIDTELDINHEYFTMKEAGSGRLTKEVVDRISSYLSTRDFQKDSYYINEKLPYVVNYENYTTDTYCSDPEVIHGSHVSGIAVGNGAGVPGSNYEINGNAPNAQLVFMGNPSLRTETILASMDDCLYLEVDVVNCSFGTQGVMLYGTVEKMNLEHLAVENMERTGIQVCVSAGNSDKYAFDGNALLRHPAYSIPGYPNALPSVLTIASAENMFNINTLVTASDRSVYEVNINAEYDAYDLDEKMIEYVVVPGVGTAADFEGIDVSGKYVLVRRGEITFEEKSRNAAEAGATGIIFYNNVPEEGALIASGSVLPGFFLSLEDGLQLEDLPDKTLRFDVSVSYQEGDPDVSDFTNWGATNLLTLKPDLMCFGGAIYSSVPDNKYDFLNGTSMASPQAAGLYAVMKQHLATQKETYGIKENADYSGIISDLLMSTAQNVLDSENGVVISPRRQGNGVPNIKKALETPAYLYTDSLKDYNRPKISLGDDRDRTGNYSFSFYVKNISDAAVTYELSYDLISDAVSGDHTENPFDDVLASHARNLSGSVKFCDVEGSEIDTITVGAEAVAKIDGFISLSAEDMAYMDRYFENGTYAEGYIYLKNGLNPDLLLSFMGFYGSWLDSPVFDAFLYDGAESYFEPSYLYSEGLILGMNLMDLLNAVENPVVSVPCFSPNGDGVFDSFAISTTFLRPVYDLTFKIYNGQGAVVYEQYVGDNGSWDATFNHALSKVEIKWDGKDTDGLIHNGEQYQIEYTCRVVKEDDAWVHAYVPILVDTENPELLSLFYGETIDGADAIYVNAADNQGVQGAMLIGPDGEHVSVNKGISYKENKWSVALNLPEDSTGYHVEIYDYAGNCTAIPAANAARYLDGDTTGDGIIDGKDVTLLLQYFADWDVSMNPAAADADADGEITGVDATLLLQYLADWDVVLGAA